MEGFRSGTRPATVMDRIMKGFSPEETKALADWWASQR
jgi:cytochrome c553